MHSILDAADGVYWWLRHHLAIAAAIVVAVVLGLVALATLTGGDDTAEIPAGAVAVVGDRPITEEQLSRWQAIYAKGAAGVDPAAKPSAEQTRRAAFQLLAGSTYILQEAKRQDVDVPAAEVDKGIDAYFTQSGAKTPADRDKILQQLGIEVDDLRYQQRVSLLSTALRERVSKAVPKPSAEAVEAAYAKEPQRWAKPSQRDLRAVIAPDKASAEQAKAALEGGATFGEVTKKYSVDASLAEGQGMIEDLKPGSNAAVLERPVFAAPLGELQGPLSVDGGWIVFKVQKITPLPEQDLEAAGDAIRRDLRGAAQTKATNTFITGLRDRWKARTRCTPPVSVPEFCSKA